MLEFTNIFLMLGYNASFDFILLSTHFISKTQFYHVLPVKRFYRWLYGLTLFVWQNLKNNNHTNHVRLTAKLSAWSTDINMGSLDKIDEFFDITCFGVEREQVLYGFPIRPQASLYRLR